MADLLPYFPHGVTRRQHRLSAGRCWAWRRSGRRRCRWSRRRRRSGVAKGSFYSGGAVGGLELSSMPCRADLAHRLADFACSPACGVEHILAVASRRRRRRRTRRRRCRRRWWRWCRRRWRRRRWRRWRRWRRRWRRRCRRRWRWTRCAERLLVSFCAAGRRNGPVVGHNARRTRDNALLSCGPACVVEHTLALASRRRRRRRRRGGRIHLQCQHVRERARRRCRAFRRALNAHQSFLVRTAHRQDAQRHEQHQPSGCISEPHCRTKPSRVSARLPPSFQRAAPSLLPPCTTAGSTGSRTL